MKRVGKIIADLLVKRKYILQYLGVNYMYDADRQSCWCGETLIPDWGWLDTLKQRCPYPPRSFQLKCPRHPEKTRVTVYFTGGQVNHDRVVNQIFQTTQHRRTFVWQKAS